MQRNLSRRPEALISTRGLRKTYKRGREEVHALRGVNLHIAEGEFVTVMGPSGCGKSTLLHLLGGIDRPSSGQVIVNGQDLGKASEEELTRFRREHVGFIFQFYNLLPTLSALENVELPLIALRFPRKGRRRMAQAVLEVVGLGDRLHHKPGELSGGEQQRVAIARAMVADPKIILADEPTGDLDSKSAQMIVGLMRELNEKLGLTFLVVTHDPEVGSQGSRTIYLKDGQIVGDERRSPEVGGADKGEREANGADGYGLANGPGLWYGRDPKRAAGSVVFQDTRYYFCSSTCLTYFRDAPLRYLQWESP